MSDIKFRLPAYFQDNMILQQGITNRIFGQTKANAKLQVVVDRIPEASTNQKSSEVKTSQKIKYGNIYNRDIETDQRGFFDFVLPALEGSKDSYKITLKVENSQCIINHVMFGEVWLALGESNMSMPSRYTDVYKQIDKFVNLPYLRFFTMSEHGLDGNNDNYLYHPTAKIAQGKWHKVSRENAANFSAIALVFAANLQMMLNLPVAIYDLAAYDTMIHSWLPRNIIEEDENIKNHLIRIEHYRDLNDWNDLHMRTPKTTEIQLRAARYIPKFTKKNQPSAMYNHKLSPFTGLSIRGIILAHGESDVFYPKYYLKAFKYFTDTLKELFHSFKRGPALIYSQLAPYFYDAKDDKTLAYFNERLTIARRQISLEAGLVTVYDLPLGYDAKNKHPFARPLNPIAKLELAKRMFHLAKGLVYQANSPISAPEIKYAEWISEKLILSFDNVGDGLILPEGDLSLKGFNICNQSSRYITAEANKLFGVRTLIWHPEITNPTSCSYGFSTFNQYANLKSSFGMPVVPFRLSPDQPDNALRTDFMLCDRLKGWVVPVNKPYDVEMPIEQKPGYHWLWKITEGKASLKLDSTNKRSSVASMVVQFEKADQQDIIFEPILGYASLYPPLDLSIWTNLDVEIFNADHSEKQIALRIIDQDGQIDQTQFYKIEDLLAWQSIRFIIQKMSVDLRKIVNLQFILKTEVENGEITIDSLKCTGLIKEEI